MYKLLASDIDDTLLTHEGGLPEATHAALQLLHDAGVAVVLSSGRATASMRPIAARIVEPADDEYLISFNGGRVVTALSDTVLFEQAISSRVIEEIMTYAREENLHVQAYSHEGFLVEDIPGTSEEESRLYSDIAGLPYERVKSLSGALPRGSVKLLIIGEHEDLLVHQERLRTKAAGRFSVMFSKPRYLEVVAKGVSKGHALEMLAGRLNIPLSRCIALGDSTNDIEMIQTAGLGVAVGNARQELKDIADHVLTRHASRSAILELISFAFPDIASSSRFHEIMKTAPPDTN